MRRAGDKGNWNLRVLGMNEMVVGLRYANPTYVTDEELLHLTYFKAKKSLRSRLRN